MSQLQNNQATGLVHENNEEAGIWKNLPPWLQVAAAPIKVTNEILMRLLCPIPFEDLYSDSDWIACFQTRSLVAHMYPDPSGLSCPCALCPCLYPEVPQGFSKSFSFDVAASVWGGRMLPHGPRLFTNQVPHFTGSHWQIPSYPWYTPRFFFQGMQIPPAFFTCMPGMPGVVVPCGAL
jgi:hypothetical protein